MASDEIEELKLKIDQITNWLIENINYESEHTSNSE